MDISPEYIKQCEKATEIQNIARKSDFDEHGNHYADGRIKIPTTWFCCDCGTMAGSKSDKRIIWLPNQSQLQQMSGFSPKSTEAITKAIYSFRFSGYGCLFAFVATMEQLWLAYLMREKYGKIWRKQEWVRVRINVRGRSQIITAPELDADGHFIPRNRGGNYNVVQGQREAEGSGQGCAEKTKGIT